MATNKKRGVLTGPDPDDRIVHEMLRDDKARYEKADAAHKKDGKATTAKKTPAKKTVKK